MGAPRGHHVVGAPWGDMWWVHPGRSCSGCTLRGYVVGVCTLGASCGGCTLEVSCGGCTLGASCGGYTLGGVMWFVHPGACHVVGAPWGIM